MCAGYEATRKGCMEGTLYQKILQGDEAISIVGLGYVGLPIAVAFAEKGVKVIGKDWPILGTQKGESDKQRNYMKQNSEVRKYGKEPVWNRDCNIPLQYTL